MKAIYLYILLGIIVIASQILHFELIENFSKPLLMPSLIIVYLYECEFNRFDYLIISALFFSMLGDVFLMPFFDHFIGGLASFLMAHLLYINAFRSEKCKSFPLTTINYVKGGASIIFYIGLLYIIYQKLIPEQTSLFLIIAIGVYATALLLLFVFSILRDPINPKSYVFINIGAALFLLSDGFLAINKFVFELPYSTLWVMPTYLLAQYLIVKGSLNRNSL